MASILSQPQCVNWLALVMRDRHVIHNTNHDTDRTAWAHYSQIYELTKPHLGGSPRAVKHPSWSLKHTSSLDIYLPYLQRTQCFIPNVKFINSSGISIFETGDPRAYFKGIPSSDVFRPGLRISVALVVSRVHVTANQIGPDALSCLPDEGQM